MMRRHPFRAASAVTVGSWLQSCDPDVAELMARAGFDWLVVDLEHSAMSLGEARALIQVCDLAGTPVLVRLPGMDPGLAKRVMDAGAYGVIFPSVRSREEAEAAVRAVRYPPTGDRGVGLGRAQAFGGRFAEYVEGLDEWATVVVMIEDAAGAAAAADIAATPGLDAVLVGPYDLSASLGVPGKLDDPRVLEARAKILAETKAVGMRCGIHMVHADAQGARRLLAEGFDMIAYGGDMLLLAPAIVRAAADAAALRKGSE